MNLWLLTGEYPPDYGGGIATYSYHTAQMLCQRGHHLTIFVTDKSINGWQIEEPSDHLRVIRFGTDQSPQSSALGEFARWSYDAALVLADFCRREGSPDVLEVQEYLGMPYFTLQRRLVMDEALAKLPILVTAHTPLYLCHLYDLLPAHRFPGYWIGEMERFSMVAADEVVFPSNYLRNEVQKDLPQIEDYSRVIANPYQDQVGTVNDNSHSARKGFLFTSKLERRKGIEPLLSTFKQLWDAGLDEPLLLVGDDWYDELKKHWMSEFIKRRYKKYLDAALLQWEGIQSPQMVMQKLGEVRAMVLPSLLENYPYAVLEAMSAGCPVIVSQSGGHAEMVEDGLSGFVFSHLQPRSMEEKIQAVLQLTSDEHDRMVKAARVRVNQISGYEVIAPQKEAALQCAYERTQPRKHFPFLRDIRRDQRPQADQPLDIEPGLLSVVIPFYNLGNYVEDAIQPFDNLKEVPYEIIVVDDGSTDQNSLETIKRLQEHYHFRLERTKNQGLAEARNTGARLARGEFLAFLDADDSMAPSLYPRAVKVLNQYENVSFVGCWMEYFGDAIGYWPTWNPEPPYALVHNPINTGALVYRRGDFLRYGQNDPIIGFIMEDYDSMLSLLENGFRGVVIPEPYMKYRIRSDSMFHTTNDTFKIWTYQQVVQKHQALYSAFTEDVLGLTTANGPGYLFDNPTIAYPEIGYLAEPDALASVSSNHVNLSRASSGTLFYYLFRSIFAKSYDNLLGVFPGLKTIRDKVKLLMTRN